MQPANQPSWFCPQCGHQNQLSFKFCTDCGTGLPPGAPVSEVLPSIQQNKKPSSFGWTMVGWVIIGVTAFVLVGLAMIGAAMLESSRSSGSTSVEQANTSPTSTPTESATPPPTPIPLTPEQLREKLKTSYDYTMSASHTHLNFIRIKTTKIKGGYALWAQHEYFGQYTLSIGETAKVIQDWMGVNIGDLREAKIVRVGVMSAGGYGGYSYFDVD